MEKLTPEKAVELMKSHGKLITVEQAKLILEILRKFAGIALAIQWQNVTEDNQSNS